MCFVPLQNGGLAWSDDADGGRGREISRDFAKVCNVSFVIMKGAVLQWVVVSDPQEIRTGVACESHLVVVYLWCEPSCIRWNFSLCFFFFFWGVPGLQLYELDGDPERKEFLDDLFVFMQKRGECAVYSVFQRDEYELSAYCVQVTVSHPPCGVPAS